MAYGSPNQFTYRGTMQRISPVCHRLECINPNDELSHAVKYQEAQQTSSAFLPWLVSEIIVNAVFTIEVILRFLVAQSFVGFITTAINIVDVLSIVPFYAEIIGAALSCYGMQCLNFAILPSSPENVVVVVLR